MNKKNIFVLNTTNALPQRTLLISETLSRENSCLLYNWEREKNAKTLHKFKSIEIRTRINKIIFFKIKVFFMIIKKPFDCILLCDFRLFPLAIIIRFIKGVKILYDAQEFPVVTIAQKLNKYTNINFSRLLKIIKLVEKLFIKRADGILSIPLINTEIQRYKTIKNNFEIIKNYPLFPLEVLNQNLKEETKDNPYIIYSGTIASYTGIDHYLMLIKQILENKSKNKLTLMLAGKLVGISESQLYNKMSTLGIKQHVKYLGWLPYELLLTYISKAIFGLSLFDPNYKKFSYIDEGTSRKIFTYMACGIPVITNLPLGKIVDKEKCGVVISYDVEELYEQAVSLLNDEAKRIKLGMNGYSAIKNKYNWNMESNKINRVFRSMWKK